MMNQSSGACVQVKVRLAPRLKEAETDRKREGLMCHSKQISTGSISQSDTESQVKKKGGE